ncbi:MAG: Ig-like domain-containing protein [Gemmatimonadaceae bacterium]
MSNILARRIALAGTITFVIGCGHDDTLTTSAQLSADSVSAGRWSVADTPTNIVVSPNPVPALAIGGKVTLGAVITNVYGSPMTRVVYWTSSNTAVATVGSNGLVSAKSAGSTVIRGYSASVPTLGDTVTIVVQGATSVPAAVKSITVGLSTSSLVTTSTAQATATLKDSLGQVLTGRTVTWMSLSPTIATVNATTGVVTAVAPGSSAITATSGAVTGSASIVVTASVVVPPTGSEVLATLPQVYLNTTMPAAPAAGGKVISVAAGGNLQAAINSALPGDVIELANGATFSGNFTLPNKNTASTNWVVIRPANMSAVPAEGSRMTPSKAAAANLPKVISTSNQGAFNTANGAHHFRLVALEVSVPASIANTGLIRLGTSYESTVAQLPHDLVLDRMYIHGTATGTNRRCVSLNGASSAVIDSYISDCHEANGDAQAIAGWSGPGPFKIVNNYLEASGENVMFGGGDPLISGVIPSDIEIRRNHITKPVSWKGGPWTVKNLFEIKNARRVLVDGNILENNWAAAQGGSAINLKSVNQGGTCRWCIASDITFSRNLIKNIGSGFNLTGYDAAATGSPTPMTRVTITGNVITGINSGMFDGDGRAFLINNNPIDLVISHNTAPDPTNMAVTFGGPISELPTRLVFRDNIVGGGQYAVKGPGLSPAATIAMFLSGGGWRGNVMLVAPADAGGFLIGTSLTTLSAVGFVSSPLDLHLSASSIFRLKATDGRDPGADVSAVNAAIAGVIVP